MAKFMDLTGREYGRLRVLGQAGWRQLHKYRVSRWRCLCAPELGGCGNETDVTVGHLNRGTTLSCGCLAAERRGATSVTHGASRGKTRTNKVTPEYSSWSGMRRRCMCPKDKKFHRYGGRGIAICSRWMSFENFVADVGPRPSLRHTIGRPNNDGGYWCGHAECPECSAASRERNGRWEDRFQQARNRSNNTVLEFRGERRCIAEWAEIVGIAQLTIAARVRGGWSVENALTVRPSSRNKHAGFGQPSARRRAP